MGVLVLRFLGSARVEQDGRFAIPVAGPSAPARGLLFASVSVEAFALEKNLLVLCAVSLPRSDEFQGGVAPDFDTS